MSRLKILAVLLSFTLAAPVQAWDEPTVTDIINTSRAGVVKIEVRGFLTVKGQQTTYENRGSGFVVTPDGHVITTAHLIPKGLQQSLISGRLGSSAVDDDHEEHFIRMEVVGDPDYGLDVALLKFQEKPEGLRALPLGLILPLMGENLYVLGFPGGKETVTRDDVVSQAPNRYMENNRFEYHGIANHGNSGGPILDRRGFVVGIVAEDQEKINGIPVVGIHQGIPSGTLVLALPEEFKAATVRPLFLVETEEPLWTFEKQNDAHWSPEKQRMEAEAPFAGPQSNFCGLSISSQWSLTKGKKWFSIYPPPQSELAAAGFEFSQSVRPLESFENFIEDEPDTVVRTPYGMVPHHYQSILLKRMSIKLPSRQEVRTIPFLLSVVDKDYEVLKYRPRYIREHGAIDELDGDDVYVAICHVRRSFPLKPFLQICENLMTQVTRDIQGVDNPCLPGSSKSD
jgi:hypothetical protein